MKISWLLHLHQPSTQSPEVVKDISNSSYRPLLAVLQRHAGFKITLDISGSLLTWWSENPEFFDILDNLRALVSSGQVEIVGSGFCHPVLPLLPESEIKRQIELQEMIIKSELIRNDVRINPNIESIKNVGAGFSRPQSNPNDGGAGDKTSPLHMDGSFLRLRGFFPPELAINDTVINILSEKKYDWVLVDEVAALGKSHFLSLPKTTTKVVVRDRGASLAIAFGFAQTVNGFANLVDAYNRFTDQIVIALDGETFGHHWPNGSSFLEEIAKLDYLYLTISDLLKTVPFEPSLGVAESSWGASDADLLTNNNFPYWRQAGNKIHDLQWELTRLAIKVVSDSDHRSRELLDKALNSDQYWWASKNPYWGPQMIERGATGLVAVVDSTSDAIAKAKAHELYAEIIKLTL